MDGITTLSLQIIQYAKLSEIRDINDASKVEESKFKSMRRKNGELEHHEKVFPKEHEDDKQALIIGMTSVIIGLIRYFQ